MARLALYSITINLYDKFGNLICSRIYAISWSCGGFTKESIQDESTNFNISNLVDLRIIYFSCIPNPVTDESIIQYQLNQICDVKIELINLLGEREKEIFNGKNNYNINSLSLNAKNLVKGFYILKLNACGLIKTIPIIIE